MPRQRLGQHFLADLHWQRRILETLPLAAGDTWLEIGAGHGEMTAGLAAKGLRVIAVEADPKLAGALRERAKAWPAVEVRQADILKSDLTALPARRFRVYGSLPYYITSPILHRLFESAGRIASVHVVVQLEVAVRITAKPGRRDYGYLSVLCQFYSRPDIALRIPPGAFRPPPRVSSALVEMFLPGARAALAIGDDAKFLGFVQACFGQKRKTLRNNLRTLAPAARIQNLLAGLGLGADARAEQMTLAQFAHLFAALEGSAR